MSVPASSQTVDRVIDGLITACCSIYGAALDPNLGEYAGIWNDGTEDRTLVVVDGMPGGYMPDVIIAVGSAVRQPVERPVMGTNRPREIAVEVDVVLSVAVAGNTTAARSARRTVNAAADALELYFRIRGNETLGGACREAWVSALTGPTPSFALAQDGGVWGRVAEVTATVTAYVRN